MAPMNNRKVHLRLRNGSGACGLSDPQLMTTLPVNVTCGRCQRSLAMADAEVKYAMGTKMRRMRRSRKGMKQ